MDESTKEARSVEKARLAAVSALLGARSVLRKVPQSSLEAHELILKGLPSRALSHLVRNFVFLRWDDSFARAIGMSHRTYQRLTSSDTEHLDPVQGGRAWKLAEILAKAIGIFGSKEEAERWLERPAIGLDQRKPIDLLATPAGVELVEDLLIRLEYGVYS